ncbi:MAG: hypothetical protein ACLTJG_13380 [[Clostridium] innocuum]
MRGSAWVQSPGKTALSLPQAQELLFAQKHGALYNVQKEQLYAYEDAKKLADAWKYGCQQLLVPKWKEAPIWEALWIIRRSPTTAEGYLYGDNSGDERGREELSAFAKRLAEVVCRVELRLPAYADMEAAGALGAFGHTHRSGSVCVAEGTAGHLSAVGRLHV